MNRDNGPDAATCILCASLTGPGCPYHGRRSTMMRRRTLRAASLLLAAIAMALAVAGCQTPSARPSDGPTSFWPCPAGQTFTEHHQVWGCFP